MYPSIVRGENLTQISYAIINSINDRIIKKKRVFLIISLQYFCYVNRGGLFFRESIILEIVSVVLRHWIRFVWREGGNEDQA